MFSDSKNFTVTAQTLVNITNNHPDDSAAVPRGIAFSALIFKDV
jgi:hypothetical protein